MSADHKKHLHLTKQQREVLALLYKCATENIEITRTEAARALRIETHRYDQLVGQLRDKGMVGTP